MEADVRPGQRRHADFIRECGDHTVHVRQHVERIRVGGRKVSLVHVRRMRGLTALQVERPLHPVHVDLVAPPAAVGPARQCGDLVGRRRDRGRQPDIGDSLGQALLEVLDRAVGHQFDLLRSQVFLYRALESGHRLGIEADDDTVSRVDAKGKPDAGRDSLVE